MPTTDNVINIGSSALSGIGILIVKEKVPFQSNFAWIDLHWAHIYVGRVVFSCQRQACATSGHDVVIIAWFHQEIKLSGVFEIIRVIIRVRVQICYAFFCISVVHKLCPLKKNNNALEAFKIEM